MFETMAQNIENVEETEEIGGSPAFLELMGRVTTYIENRFVKKCLR